MQQTHNKHLQSLHEHKCDKTIERDNTEAIQKSSVTKQTQMQQCDTDFGAKLIILSHITMPLDLDGTRSPFFKT